MPAERQKVLNVLNSDRFGDKPPAQIYAALLDEKTYLCSISTMYRILRENDLVKERRDILRHPVHIAGHFRANHALTRQNSNY